MKKQTAWRLLSELLNWSDTDLADEMSAMQLLIDLKYDRYHGFQPATKFHVALINWLKQFHSVEERRIFYRFARDRIVFISQKEMYHLVSLMMPCIERKMRCAVADMMGINFYETWQNSAAQNRLDIMRRKTLFVGLSDGARIDVFRRYNEGAISNEQVVPYAEISGNKWADLIKELRCSLDEKGLKDESEQFEAVCLVDDFSGSGSSLIRDVRGEWKGKVPKFCTAYEELIGTHLKERCTLYIHHHLASSSARKKIEANLNAFSKVHDKFKFIATFSYILPDSIVLDDNFEDQELVNAILGNYDPGIEDRHTGPDIWYGYKQCGLPLVLDHNTPNNSVALLWAQSPKQDQNSHHPMKPLFSRRKRHSSDG